MTADNKNIDFKTQYKNYCDIMPAKLEHDVEFETTFKKIYGLNFLIKRIEVKNRFQIKEFINAYSSLLEAFDLLHNNYVRASLLVLRNSIESFIKFIIQYYAINNNIYKINNRVYTANKNTVSKIIASETHVKYHAELNSSNSKLETIYSDISIISHSASKNFDFFNKYICDIRENNEENINKANNKIKEVVDLFFYFCIVICEDSILNWEREEVKQMLRFLFGVRRTDNLILKIKSKK